MSAIEVEYMDWIAGQAVEGYALSKTDADHIRLRGEFAVGEVSVYRFENMPEIVEMRVESTESGEVAYFLHFELLDLERAKELFSEMAAALVELREGTTTHVLLCCTVGMTTTLFASKLNEAAKALSLDYVFEARALEQAKESGGQYAAVMLAPQVGFRRDEVAQAFPNAAVFEIPAKTFGRYDAGSALRTLLRVLGDNSLSTPDPTSLDTTRGVANKKRIMLIALVHRPKVSSIYWHVYDHDKHVASGETHKPLLTPQDVSDVLATLSMHDLNANDLDAVCIASPGIVHHGKVSFSHFKGTRFSDINIAAWLSEHYGVRVLVVNNAHAAAVGCYLKQDKYHSVVFHAQHMGYPFGGQGIVVDGHLIHGRLGYSGNILPINNRLAELEGIGQEEKTRYAWRSDRMLPLLAEQLLPAITIAAPDAIYLNYDLVDDMDALREELAKHIEERYIPDLIHVNDYADRILLGEMGLVLQYLNNPDQTMV
ncbi:MAG: ROK family protein [Atopobiaceae bacterium]|nr:ROK family protein [Atopobiaceae bacterium]